jgi:hypothetical protein
MAKIETLRAGHRRSRLDSDFRLGPGSRPSFFDSDCFGSIHAGNRLLDREFCEIDVSDRLFAEDVIEGRD